MKKTILAACMLAGIYTVNAQDFKTSLVAAKSDYSAGKFAEARFAMQQLLQQIDEKAGQEVLKVYPQDLAGFKPFDNGTVSGNGGSLGVNISRSYKLAEKTIEVSTLTNSPLLASVNAMLSAASFIGGPDQKMIKVQGYKALLQKSSGDAGSRYTIQIPMGNALVTLQTEKGATDAEALAAAQAIPLDKIAGLLQ